MGEKAAVSGGLLGEEGGILLQEGVKHLVALLEAACLHTGDPLVFIDHLDMVVYGTMYNSQGIVHLPAPVPPNCNES